mmetsp:Transcript_67398/g.171062  ORF Transcript_67398/g.171062 Transcript_67398/m.171062 type:complete len:203 (-) Transcript_67398:1064-1672(-)
MANSQSLSESCHQTDVETDSWARRLPSCPCTPRRCSTRAHLPCLPACSSRARNCRSSPQHPSDTSTSNRPQAAPRRRSRTSRRSTATRPWPSSTSAPWQHTANRSSCSSPGTAWRRTSGNGAGRKDCPRGCPDSPRSKHQSCTPVSQCPTHYKCTSPTCSCPKAPLGNQSQAQAQPGVWCPGTWPAPRRRSACCLRRRCSSW